MKAAYINATGPADTTIQFGDLPKPAATDSHVLIKVGAVALNPIDTYLRNGANYWELPKPFIIGCDVAGTIEAIGPNVKRFKVGDRVWGSNQGLLGRQGTFAEYCAADEQWLYPTPHTVTDDEAAACALVGITAHLGLFREAKLEVGESIFVNGGSGGVGSMVVQMAKIAGARVLATAGSAEKVAALKKLGADVAVNYKTDDIAAAVKQFAPSGVNVYWETVREPDFDKIVSYLAERGRLVLMAGRDARPPFPVGPFYVKGCSLHGFVMFKATAVEQRNCAESINQWLLAGKLKAHISQTMPLAQAAAAHKLQEENTLQKSGMLAGKIVLKL
ncbi:MAG TPA: NADPH:quinone reductase [Pirellulaceae bacterium]